MPFLAMFSGIKNYLIIGSLAAAGLFYYMWQVELESNANLKASVNILNQKIERSEETIKSLSDQNLLNTDNLKTLLQANDKLSQDLNVKLQENNELRAKEAQLALQNPYERGNVATDRFNDLLLSFTGTSSSYGAQDNTDSTNSDSKANTSKNQD